MNLRELRVEFEKNKKIYESAKLDFVGICGYDIYNCSVPFEMDGKYYIYGRVEKPDEWARSRVMLFECIGTDVWMRVTNSMIYQMENPNIAVINGKIVLSGSFIFCDKGINTENKSMFYYGDNLEDMRFFAMGPNAMKDIRIVQMSEGKIGVFSRPRGEEILNKFGSSTAIGFTVINSLDELCEDVINNAKYIPGMFSKEEWGGPNQAYFLESGNIGIIGHQSYCTEMGTSEQYHTYLTMAFVFDPVNHKLLEQKIIATRNCFPDYRSKIPLVTDCTYPSGIVMRDDGKCDLFCGISDTAEGRITIDYPFAGYGKIVKFDNL